MLFWEFGWSHTSSQAVVDIETGGEAGARVNGEPARGDSRVSREAFCLIPTREAQLIRGSRTELAQRSNMAMGQNPVPPVNIRIPTKID